MYTYHCKCALTLKFFLQICCALVSNTNFTPIQLPSNILIDPPNMFDVVFRPSNLCLKQVHR